MWGYKAIPFLFFRKNFLAGTFVIFNTSQRMWSPQLRVLRMVGHCRYYCLRPFGDAWVWQDTNLRSLSAMDLQSTSFVHSETYPFDGLPVSIRLFTAKDKPAILWTDSRTRTGTHLKPRSFTIKLYQSFFESLRLKAVKSRFADGFIGRSCFIFNSTEPVGNSLQIYNFLFTYKLFLVHFHYCHEIFEC